MKDMMVEERMAAAERRKVDGNDLFKKGMVEEAIEQYEIVSFLSSVRKRTHAHVFVHVCRNFAGRRNV